MTNSIFVQQQATAIYISPRTTNSLTKDVFLLTIVQMGEFSAMFFGQLLNYSKILKIYMKIKVLTKL